VGKFPVYTNIMPYFVKNANCGKRPSGLTPTMILLFVLDFDNRKDWARAQKAS
jgi:hypothetical protein